MPEKQATNKAINAIVSVSDPTNLESLGKALGEMGANIYATGGTKARLQAAGVDAQVSVRRLQQTFQFVERQSIVHRERADDAEPEPLVNQPVERKRRLLRRFSADCRLLISGCRLSTAD